MNEEYLKEFNIFLLQQNYNNLTNYLYNLQNHINSLYENNFLLLYDRNIYLGKIYENIKNLNDLYNKMIILENENILYIKKYNNTNILSYENLYNLLIDINIILKDKQLNLILNPLNNIKQDIINISNKIGNKNINLILDLIFDKNYIKKYNIYTQKLLNFLSNSFIILNFKLVKNNFKNNITNTDKIILQDENINEINMYFNDISIELKKNNNDKFLNKIIVIKIRNLYNNKYLYFEGIFLVDSINLLIKTCQISNKFIYYKKKILEYNLSKTKASKKFAKKFFKTLTICEILSYNKQYLIKILNKNYNIYQHLISNSFMEIMKDFIKKNNTITNMYDTIKLLLLGDDENINTSGLLFGITKDKKINLNIISNIIYRNLTYVLQIKLKKVSSYLKDELKRLDKVSINNIDYKKQLLSIDNIPNHVKSLTLEKINEMKSSNNDYHKQLLYVNSILKFPWSSKKDDNYFKELNKDVDKRIKFITDVEKKLNEYTYGHNEAKQNIIQTIGKWITNPNSNGNVIGIYGPPGVGKTMLAKSIGEILNIPFAQITLGGQNDGELLHGHGYTYSGAQPGLIIKKMIDNGASRCILYFDELDKACSKKGNNEISSILIHLTDPNMNNSYQDRFFQGIDFPLNKVIMIFSYNDPNLIDPILLDRFIKVKVEPYSLEDKIQIFQKFIFKEICNNINFNINDFTIKKKNIIYLIENYTMEAGVRDLKRKISNIMLSLNLDRLYNRGLFKNQKSKINITNNIIQKILDKPKLEIEKIHLTPSIGVINGLYATSMGTGGIVPIQIFHLFSTNNFELKLTGNQGKVMQESVQCAFTTSLNYINNNKEKYNIQNIDEFIKNKLKYGYHIHAPSGATPKDGPSAGSAFTIAFISILLDKKIKHDHALTGEVDLTGKISKIGGLEYKINGAIKAGVKKIFIPKENLEDLNNIKKKINLKNIEIINVEYINEIIENNIFI